MLRLDKRLAQYQRQSDWLSRWRLLLFLLSTAVSVYILWQFGPWVWGGITLILIIGFAYTVRLHRRVETAITRHKLWRQLKQMHLARMRLDWDTIPETLPTPPDLDHPFARDLDIIGHRSLHRLLDTAVTHQGSVRLRDWLLETTPNPENTAVRQTLIRELTDLSSFRDRLILSAIMSHDNGETEMATAVFSGKKWPGQRLLEWLNNQKPAPTLRPALIILSLLAACNITLLLLDAIRGIGNWWLITWIPYALIAALQARQTAPVFEDASFLADGLRKLQAIFHMLETYQYGGRPQLRTRCAPFLDEEKRPSNQLRRVSRIVGGAGVRYNPGLWLLLNALLPWDSYFAYRMNQASADLQTLLPRWLDTLYELEALSSLAHFAYLNPNAQYPEFTPAASPILFKAQAIGHPLIPAAASITNDAQFKQLGDIFLITGSNMAGKSTFLRTLGINLCLAYAGGPVVAQRLQTQFFRLYTSIQVADSLTNGFSFFYAEVRRLQAMLAALQQETAVPLFFLIDEIFRGTNNRERLIGSREFVRALAGGFGIGAIATHDLELVKLADELPGLYNFHFRDDVENGRMIFDYKLHTGPCPTTNALQIMRLAGLPIGETIT